MVFNCPKCDKRIQVSDEKAGKKGKCPGCGEILTIPSPEEEPEEEALDVLPETGMMEAVQAPEEKKPQLDPARIRQEIDPVMESVQRLADLSEKAKSISENLQLIESTLSQMKEEMESHLHSTLILLEPADEPAQAEPEPDKKTKPSAEPLTEEELTKVAVKIANEKRGEYRCMSCRTVWVGKSRLLGANPTEPWKCPNGCNATIVL